MSHQLWKITPACLILIASIVAVTFSQDSPADVDMCDVTAWYTEMTAEDVFSDPSPEVAAIEEEIKELISSGDQDAVLVSCAVLASYEETLLGPTDDSDLHEDTVDTGQSEEFDDSEAAEDPGESENSLGEDLTLENIVADILEDGGDWDGKVKNELLHDKDRESNSPGEDSQEDPSLEEEQRTDGSEPEGQPPETMETVGLPTDLEGDSPGADSEETCTKGGGSGRCDPKEGCHMWESSTKVRPNNGGAPGEGHSDKEVDDKDMEPQPEVIPLTQPGDSSLMSDTVAQQLAVRRIAYNTRLHNIEIQLLKLENKLLMESLNKNNDTTLVNRLENQMLKLENELLRMNASFILLHAENIRLRALGEELKSTTSSYLALPDQNTTIMQSMVTKHQDKIAELSDVISKQTNLIETLDARARQLEERNGHLYTTLFNQSSLMEDIMNHIEDLRHQQKKHSSQYKEETQKLYEKLESVEEASKAASVISSKDTLPPEVMGGLKKGEQQGTAGGSNMVLPTGKDKKVSGVNPDKGAEDIKEEDSKNPVSPDTTVLPEESDIPNKADEDDTRADTVTAPSNTIHSGDTSPQKGFKMSSGPEGTKDKELSHSTTVDKTGQSNPTGKDGKAKPRTPSKAQQPENVNIRATEKAKQRKPSKIGSLKTKTGVRTSEKHIDSPGKVISQEATSDQTNTKPKPVKGKATIKSKGARKVKTKYVPPKPKYVDPEYKGMKDCYDHYVQGRKRDTTLKVRPVGMTRDHDVFCDMRSGGWTVIQRRQDGSTDFYRDWADYKKGFGGMYGEHWLGLDLVHRLTNQGHYQLRIDFTDWQRHTVHALYDLFLVDDEGAAYRLHIGGYNGTAGDGMASHNNMKFSTRDVDNDQAVKDFGGSCAKRFHGAWWYYKCYKSNLNGRYYRGGDVKDGQFDGVAWKAWKGSKVSLKKVEMKIRRKV